METRTSEETLSRIEELENRLAEAERLIEAIKTGEVDAFALYKNNRPEIFTLQSGDYAYRILVENFSGGALNLSEEGLIVYTNTYFHDLLKMPYDKVIGTSIFQFIHTESIEAFKVLFKKGLTGQIKGEINLVAGNNIYPVYVSLTSLYPSLPSVGMIVTDLSDKKENEKISLRAHEFEKAVIQRTAEINKQKEFTEAILNSTPELVIAFDTDRRIIAFNKACEDLFEMNRRDVMGKVYNDVFRAAEGSHSHNDLLRALNGETIHNTLYHSQMTGRYFENFLSPLKDESENIYAVVAISHDITQNIQDTELIIRSEEKFNKLFATSPFGLVLSEVPSDKIVDANEIYFQTIGYSREECIGKTSMDLNLYLKNDRQNILGELFKNGIVKNVELNILTKSGVQIPILTSVEQISISGNDYFLSAIVDISAQKNAEQKIQEKNEQLNEMNKELEAFTYISSHDLQEPLRKIQTFATLIAEKEIQNLSDDGKYFFDRMQNSATRLQTLIQDLLNFSRLATTERKFEIADLNKIVADVKAEFKEVIETKGATIETVELCEVNIIPFQFRQLMQNLISNALKFSKSDVPPHIIIKSNMIKGEELNSEKFPAQKEYCHISVSDNGIGFEKHFRQKIFEVFQKLHGKEQYAGTGIGLAIVKKIVENHNGLVTAESELGKGATFNIYLPA